MTEPVLRTPTLVSFGAGARRPAIIAGRCGCGQLAYPLQSHGCERCGRVGTDFERVEIAACGVLTAIATVYVHPKLPTPFVLGRITLDGGPSIEAWLDAPPDALVVGTRVEGRLVPGTDEAGTPVLDCRFAAEGTD